MWNACQGATLNAVVRNAHACATYSEHITMKGFPVFDCCKSMEGWLEQKEDSVSVSQWLLKDQVDSTQ